MDILNKTNNIQFMNLNSYELYSILSSINKYKWKLRDNLSINKETTYSPEIEFICRSSDRANRLFDANKFDNWTLKKEITIGNGFEIVPVSFLINEKKDYEDIESILNIIKKDPLSYIDYRCGMHLNLGMQLFTDKIHIENFILLWLAYEEVIFRFCYGEYLNPRKNIDIVAQPLRKNKIDQDFDSIYNLINTTKKNAISLYKFTSFNYIYNNVIEIRCPNASLNPIIIQNELNLFCHMIDYAKEKIDVEEIKEKIKRKENIKINSYNKIFLNEAFDFVDKIFDNNLDKYYFLKQYLKNNKEIIYQPAEERMIKCKRL